MQAGLPVLASDHYGVRELIDSDCGRMVPYGNLAEAPRRLAGALAELLPQEEKLARMGELARKRASGMPFSGAADAVLAACRESLVSVSPSGGR